MVFCCSICQERLKWVFPEDGELRPCAIKCGHTFHFVCIKQWWIIKQREVAGPEIIHGSSPSIHCPICRHINIPQVFELKFLFKDDELFCTDGEMNESITLQLNLEEIMEECEQINKDLEIINMDICNEEKTKANLRAELEEAMKEKNDFQALILNKVLSSFEKISLGQQTTSAVSKNKVKVPILLDESNKEKDQIHTEKIRKKTRQKQRRNHNNVQEIIKTN